MSIKSIVTSLGLAVALVVGQFAPLAGAAHADGGHRGDHYGRPQYRDMRPMPAPRYVEQNNHRDHDRGHRNRDGAAFAGIAAIVGAVIVGSVIADRERARRHHDDD